jgi:NodT family efflux transporter outer membrane factor (OMF) lipoprotein
MTRSGVALAGLAALLCGCAVGPNFHTPAPPAAAVYAPGGTPADLSADQRLHPGQMVDPAWWRAFGSADIDALVDEALRANPDLKSADAALRQARELLSAQRGAFWPTVGLDYEGQRAKTSAALSPVTADNASLYSLHTAEVDVSYAPDVFGAVRRATEAAKAGADAQRFQYDAARTSLITNVVTAAIQQAALRGQLDAAQRAVAAGRDILSFTRRQADLGALGQADVAAQETVLAQAEQAEPPLRKALAQQQTALAILLGREPGQGAPPAVSLDWIVLPTDLPLILPAQLVRQRPDVRAAEANLHAASAQVGVAVAARIPNISLSAAAGGAGLGLQDLLTHGDDFWTLTAGVTQPVFAGGALLHRQRAAEAALDQAKAQYKGTVLAALKAVADCLDALRIDAAALDTATTAEAAGRRGLDFAQRQLALGQVGALAARNAEQAYAQEEGSLVNARAARYTDTAALFQALGGGWSDAADRPRASLR